MDSETSWEELSAPFLADDPNLWASPAAELDTVESRLVEVVGGLLEQEARLEADQAEASNEAADVNLGELAPPEAPMNPLPAPQPAYNNLGAWAPPQSLVPGLMGQQALPQLPDERQPASLYAAHNFVGGLPTPPLEPSNSFQGQLAQPHLPFYGETAQQGIPQDCYAQPMGQGAVPMLPYAQAPPVDTGLPGLPVMESWRDIRTFLSTQTNPGIRSKTKADRAARHRRTYKRKNSK